MENGRFALSVLCHVPDTPKPKNSLAPSPFFLLLILAPPLLCTPPFPLEEPLKFS